MEFQDTGRPGKGGWHTIIHGIMKSQTLLSDGAGGGEAHRLNFKKPKKPNHPNIGLEAVGLSE